MEIKSCSINEHYFCVWQEDFGYTVEDLSKGQKATFSQRSMFWLEKEFSKILQDPIHIFFFQKDQNGAGIYSYSQVWNNERLVCGDSMVSCF